MDTAGLDSFKLTKAIGSRWMHICVDMQMLFAPDTEWGNSWLPRILPRVAAICAIEPARTVFTRFVPPREPGEARGQWAKYYERWVRYTLDREGAALVDLLPELQRFVPPAEVVDKAVYSPWHASRLPAILADKGVDTVVVSGGETDICVAATLLGAIDWGYRTILVTDALCSVSDKTHDATIDLFRTRFSQHVECCKTAAFLEAVSQRRSGST